MHLPKKIYEFSSFFHSAGYSLYLVGGSVRNQLLGRSPGDYDFATDAEPNEIMKIFNKVIPTGIDHGTVTVLFRGASYEVTTFRIESSYSDRRRPDSISYTSSIREDLSRRDFTINALAVNTEDDSLIDYFSGLEDLKKGIVRAIGDPEKRFNEDALRLLRACRISTQLDFTIDSDTFTAMKGLGESLKSISAERIREELNKMLLAEKPSSGFMDLEESRLLPYILPELVKCIGIEQKGNHRFDVYKHLLYSCDGADKRNIKVRWAALLHDIGKPQSLSFDEKSGVRMFIGHEKISASIAESILNRLKFSVKERNAIVHLIRNHMFNYTSDWSEAAVRRFIARVGVNCIDDLFSLRYADRYGTYGKNIPADDDEFRKRIKHVISENDALSLKHLAVNGNDLMKKIGIPQGRILGVILNELLETVLDDPKMNSKDTLLELSRKLYEKYG
ncbi:MAG: CCA tRNA nucleotidyltransferase [Spirochaetia bacterium]|nr:CCA tRNA nucleotidyltransferase [Spirochaetia bacterium]MCF7946536.1 CCA tRNA nucleotidyltransferase [Spirochaetia bacterium]